MCTDHSCSLFLEGLLFIDINICSNLAEWETMVSVICLSINVSLWSHGHCFIVEMAGKIGFPVSSDRVFQKILSFYVEDFYTMGILLSILT